MKTPNLKTCVAVTTLIFLAHSGKSQSFLPNTTTGPTYRSGAVGIGLTQAFRMLDVAGSTSDNGIRYTSTAGSGSSGSLGLRNTNDNSEWNIWAYGQSSFNGSGNFGIGNGVANSGAVPQFFIKGLNGNVGLGTNNPTSKLTLESFGSTGLCINNSTGFAMCVADLTGAKFAVWPTGDLTIGNTNIVPTGKLNINMNGPAQAITVYDASSVINPNNKICFRVENSGFTQIGAKFPTANHPGMMLSVYGKIVATEVVVTSTANWADYVFDSKYKLKPLHEVEKFILENHHLPNVPSAATILKDGLNLKDISVVQMEKIEELTLYVIELQKQLNELKKKMKD